MFRRLPLLFILAISFAAKAGEEKEYTPPMPNIKVNGEPLSGEAIRKRYDFWLKVYKAPGKPLSKEMVEYLASISRDQMVQVVAIRQYVEKNKLAVTPDELKKDVEAFKAELAQEGKTFEEFLKSRSKTEAEFLAEYALRSAMMKATAAELEKKLDELKKTFEQEKDKSPLRRASEIRFSYEGTKYSAHPERTKADAKKLADYALERVKKGEDFAALAKELSDESVSAMAGGDLGWVASSFVPKAIATAVYALGKAGDVADVIESEQGYHLVKLTELRTDDQAFQTFVKQRIHMKTLATENKLGKDAKVEVEKSADEPKAADPKKDAEPKKAEADKKDADKK